MPRRLALALATLLVLAGCGAPRALTGGEAPLRATGRDFLWGVSTAGYQWEGDETTSQWAAWDQAGRTEERRGHAADGYRRYASDLDLTRGMGCNAFRTSVEWARIEPEEGRFDLEAIQHYRELIRAMRARGLTPIVTLQHFSYPAWLDREGGWESKEAPARFARFVARIVPELAADVDWYLTFNEPTVFVAGGWVSGQMPPGKTNDAAGAARVLRHLVQGHRLAYAAIHRLDPVAKVSFNNYSASWHVTGDAVEPEDGFLSELQGTAERVPALDYMAIDYYTRLKLALPFNLPTCWTWPVYPEGLYRSLRFYHRLTGLPVLIAENGMATQDGAPRADGWTREAYLVAHVQQLQRAIADGIPVLGYVHWSITDNYEWGSYRPRFGLFTVDCRADDQRRVPTAAAGIYRQIIAAGGVTPGIRAQVDVPPVSDR